MAAAGADWRAPDAYLRFLSGDRRCFAWEWLRRTPAYRRAVLAGGDARQFGLERFEDPAFDALVARPIWTASIDRAVLHAYGHVRMADGRIDLGRSAALAKIFEGAGGKTHILFSDGLRSIRIDVRTDDLISTPMAVTWHVTASGPIDPQLRAINQLAALVRHGRFAASLHPRERRARRWIASLRIHDAIAVGASHREIVAIVFDVDVSFPRWRATFGPQRLYVQRLAAAARLFVQRGPQAWL